MNKFIKSLPVSIVATLTTDVVVKQVPVHFDDEDMDIQFVNSDYVVQVDGFDVAAVYTYEGATHLKMNHMDNAPEDDLELSDRNIIDESRITIFKKAQ